MKVDIGTLIRKENQENTFPAGSARVLASTMRIEIVRAILTVAPRDGTWTVEFEGENFGHSSDRKVAKASAHKRARELLATGRACEVRVHGEQGYHGAR